MKKCNCPACNAALQFADDREFGFCEYCGTKVLLDDFRETIRIVDEAKIKQAEAGKMIRLREIELEAEKIRQELQISDSKNKTKTLLVRIWLSVSLALIMVGVGMILFGGRNGYDSGVAFLILPCAPIIFGGAYLVFKILPDREMTNQIKNKGGIKIPDTATPFVGKNYKIACSELENAGFTNVKCVNLGDIFIGILEKPNIIESVSIEGKRDFSLEKYYYPDVPIIIYYHGK